MAQEIYENSFFFISHDSFEECSLRTLEYLDSCGEKFRLVCQVHWHVFKLWGVSRIPVQEGNQPGSLFHFKITKLTSR